LSSIILNDACYPNDFRRAKNLLKVSQRAVSVKLFSQKSHSLKKRRLTTSAVRKTC